MVKGFCNINGKVKKRQKNDINKKSKNRESKAGEIKTMYKNIKNTFLILSVGFCTFFIGCKDKEISQKSFSYTSLDSGYEITIETPLLPSNTTDDTSANKDNSPANKTITNPKSLKEKLILQKNGKTQNRIIMLVFVDADCEDCARYYEHLNHLDAESKAMIVAVLSRKIDEKDLVALQKKYTIDFALLNPKSNQNSELLTLLIENKFVRVQNDLKSMNSFINPIESKATQKNTQSAKANDSSDSKESNNLSESQKLQPTAPKIPALPYFVLFDKAQVFYQDYEGIIPEEIFSSDIASLAR